MGKCRICGQTLGSCELKPHVEALQKGQKEYGFALNERIAISVDIFRVSLCPTVSAPYINDETGVQMIDVRPVRYTK